MQHNRCVGRPNRASRKLCVNRLKHVKTIPAQNFAAPPPQQQEHHPTAATTTTTQDDDGGRLRRSQRLQAKHVAASGGSIFADIQRRYERAHLLASAAHQGVPIDEPDVEKTSRLDIYKAATVVDLISTGKYQRTEAMASGRSNRCRRQLVDVEMPFRPVPANEWVFTTPEQQKIPGQKPKPTQMVPAFLHTTSKNKTLYEMKDDFKVEPFQLNKMPRAGLMDFDVGCVRNTVKFAMMSEQGQGDAATSTSTTNTLMQFSPIAEEAADGLFKQPQRIWRPRSAGSKIPLSPIFFVHDDDDDQQQSNGPFPKPAIHRRRRINFDEIVDENDGAADVMPDCRNSAFAPPTMENLFPFLQPGVRPFLN